MRSKPANKIVTLGRVSNGMVGDQPFPANSAFVPTVSSGTNCSANFHERISIRQELHQPAPGIEPTLDHPHVDGASAETRGRIQSFEVSTLLTVGFLVPKCYSLPKL
jgi:hypothetical protein